MASVNVKVNIHSSRVIAVCGPMIDKASYRAAQKVRGYVMSEIVAAGRVKTGAMLRGMQVRRVGGAGLTVRYEVSSSASYTMFQNNGTRAHGPRTKQMLRFIPKGGSQYVFAKWVRGVQGAHFMEKGLARLRAQDFLP